MNDISSKHMPISKDMRISLQQKRRKRTARQILEALLFITLFLVTMIPIVWGVVTSFKTEREVVAYPPKLWGFTPVFDNYRTIVAGGFFRTFLNSVFYSFSAILVGLLLGMMAAYGLHRHRFKGRKLLFYIVIAGIPLSTGSSVLLIPNYIYFSKLGLTNKMYSLTVLYAAYNLPMAIWIMRGGLENIPFEIEEAASIDGCSRSYIIFRLMPRLNIPAMASAAIFIFIGAWNEFIVASVMINSSNLRPVQLSIYHYMGFFGLNWGPLTASTTLAIVPILIVFTILGRYLVSGLMQGSVKG